MSIQVTMPDGSVFVLRSLFRNSDRSSRKNIKLRKSDASGAGYWTMGLSLAPALASGYQTCPHSTPGCRKGCIFTAGYAGIFQLINLARVAKTRAWFQKREQFQEMFVREVSSRLRWCEQQGLKLCVRLNVFSDISWERTWPQAFNLFPSVQFYDYTKNVKRAIACAGSANSITHRTPGILPFPANYDLTFSRSERNEADCLAVLRAGGRVAVVFGIKPSAWKAGQRPRWWNDYAVIDGDLTDLRFLDPKGVVVGLYAKGRGRKDTSGFVVRSEHGNDLPRQRFLRHILTRRKTSCG